MATGKAASYKANVDILVNGHASPSCSHLSSVFRFMVLCDTCSNWYHGSCVGITKKRGKFTTTQVLVFTFLPLRLSYCNEELLFMCKMFLYIFSCCVGFVQMLQMCAIGKCSETSPKCVREYECKINIVHFISLFLSLPSF